MPVHKWRRLPSKHFGEVWVPFAQIEIQGSDGTFHTLALQIDSGAVVSLLRRSMADLLRIKLDKGKWIDVTSVGGAKTEAYVHELQTRFDEKIAYAVPFAIATVETVPNLLGRLKVFDFLQLIFDGTFQETTIAAPWLDESNKLIWKELIETETHLLGRWKDLPFPGLVREVVTGLVNRADQLLVCATGLAKLHRTYTGALFIRALFELALQVEYLLDDPEPRASRYKDFLWVTKHRDTKAIADNPTGPLSTWIAQSPLRPAGEARNQAEYDRVRPQFVRKARRGQERVAQNWYGMTVRQLAAHVGWEGEYRIWYSACAAWSHADPFATQATPHWSTDTNILLAACFHYYARMLLKIAEVGEVILTREQYALLRGLQVEMS